MVVYLHRAHHRRNVVFFWHRGFLRPGRAATPRARAFRCVQPARTAPKVAAGGLPSSVSWLTACAIGCGSLDAPAVRYLELPAHETGRRVAAAELAVQVRGSNSRKAGGLPRTGHSGARPVPHRIALYSVYSAFPELSRVMQNSNFY